MSEQALFCMPVVRIGAVFRQATSADCSVRELIPYHELASFLSRHHRIEPGTVHVFGRSAEVDIFVPKLDPNDVSYILVDGDFVPVSGTDSPKQHDEVFAKARDALVLHLESLSTVCGFTDGLFAPTRLSMPHSFIWPRLRRRQIDSFGLPRRQSTALPRDCSFDDLAAEPRAVILGAPGSGKTTLLRFLAMRLAAQCLASAAPGVECVVPVYLQLRHYDFHRELSTTTAFSAWREAISCTFTPRIAWVLDGLDEVPPALLPKTKEAIERLLQENRTDAVFVCSRVASYDGFLRNSCTHFELEPFSWPQTTQWIHQYVREFDHTRTKALLHHISNVPELRTIASNPLLLSVLTHQYQFEGVIPQQRVQLLERFVAALCVEWDSCRGISRRGAHGVPPYRRSTLLSWLAFGMKSRGTTSIRTEDLESWLLRYPPLAPNLDARSILQELAEDTGLLVATGAEGTWEFSHAIFCDYLVARHLVSRTEDIAPLLDTLAGDDSWHDVWILACAVTDDARPLLERVLSLEHLSDETKALLIAGALAQGLDLDYHTIEKCRELLSEVFLRHTHEFAGTVRLYTTRRGQRLAVDRAALGKGQKESQNSSTSSKFVRSLLTLLYRARWWRTGQTVVADMRTRGGILGTLAARLIDHDGIMALSDSSSEDVENTSEVLIFEVDTTFITDE